MPSVSPTKQTPRRRPLTPWELPSLLIPMHRYRRTKKKTKVRDRDHFPAILSWIYRNRFAVTSQVQRRFPQVLRSSRTAWRHLEEMETLGYLGVAPTRSTSPLWPKVSFVTKRGLRKLREALAAKGTPWKPPVRDEQRRPGFSADHVLHEVLTTEFLLAAWQTVQGRPDLELLTLQRRSLAKHPAFRVVVDGKASRLIPDAMFLFRQRGNGIVCCFVEIDVGTMNAKQIEMKYRRYEAFAHSEAGQRYLTGLYRTHGATEPRPTFRVLIVAMDKAGANDESRLCDLARAAGEFPAALRDRLWFTTVAAIRDHQHQTTPLDATIWLRCRDVPGLPPPGSPRVGAGSARHSLFSRLMPMPGS